MKRAITLTLFSILIIVCMLQPGCKDSAQDSRSVTITVYEGVAGTPETGIYTYQIGDEISYSYSLLDGYSGLTVLLDNLAVSATGSFTVSDDHVLKAYSAGNGEFSLTVTVNTGATGTPAAGTYVYKEGEPVDYSYSLLSGYGQLTVYVDGIDADVSGTLTMTKDRTIVVSAEELIDIQGDWTMKEAYNDQSYFEVNVTFSGTMDSGTVVDSDGGSGTYTVTEFSVAFNLVFPDVTYKYVGNFSDKDNMSGTCTKTDSSGTSYAGDWIATRNTTTTAAKPPASGRKSQLPNRNKRH